MAIEWSCSNVGRQTRSWLSLVWWQVFSSMEQGSILIHYFGEWALVKSMGNKNGWDTIASSAGMSINAPFVLVTQDVGHWAPVQLIETAKLDVFEVGFELGWVKSWQLQWSVKEDSASFLDNSSSVGLGSHNQLVLFRDREGVTLLSEPVVIKAFRRPLSAGGGIKSYKRPK